MMKLNNLSLAVLVSLGVAACGGSDDNNSNKPADNGNKNQNQNQHQNQNNNQNNQAADQNIVDPTGTKVVDNKDLSKNVFIVFVAGLPRKPKRPFADWYSTYARSFSKAACSFPTRKSCALRPTASAILQNGAIRFV